MNEPYYEFQNAIVETAEKLDKYLVSYVQIVLIPYESQNEQDRMVLYMGKPEEGHPHHTPPGEPV